MLQVTRTEGLITVDFGDCACCGEGPFECCPDPPGCNLVLTATNALGTFTGTLTPGGSGCDWTIDLPCDTGSGIVFINFLITLACRPYTPDPNLFAYDIAASVGGGGDTCDFGLLTTSWSCDPVLIEFNLPAIECSVAGCTIPATRFTFTE